MMSIEGTHIVLYSCQAHMVYSEHDADFYALDSQVKMCVCSFFFSCFKFRFFHVLSVSIALLWFN
jgi:hypothetical protein